MSCDAAKMNIAVQYVISAQLRRRLYKKERKKYYANLDLKNITDNKRFWKTIKTFLTDKGTTSQKITLIESDKILSEDSKVAETLIFYFPMHLGIWI